MSNPDPPFTELPLTSEGFIDVDRIELAPGEDADSLPTLADQLVEDPLPPLDDAAWESVLDGAFDPAAAADDELLGANEGNGPFAVPDHGGDAEVSGRGPFPTGDDEADDQAGDARGPVTSARGDDVDHAGFLEGSEEEVGIADGEDPAGVAGTDGESLPPWPEVEPAMQDFAPEPVEPVEVDDGTTYDPLDDV